MIVSNHGGTAFEFIEAALGDLPEYQDFRAGKISRSDYSDWIEVNADRLIDAGLNEDRRNLSTRFPLDDDRYVAEILADLDAAGVITGVDYPDGEFEQLAKRVAEHTDHGGKMTFIFPEEARLLFALAHRVHPLNAVFLGSYYGYWAVWALPAVIAAGGRATLVDIDPEVMALAERNFTALGFADSVDFVVADAIEYSRTELRDVDLCVLDAEGPKDAPDPDLRDKAIYYPIVEAATPAMTDGGLLVAHNMLLSNLTANRYFTGRIDYNEGQFAKLTPYLVEHYDVRRVYPTSEGVGVYRRSGSPCAG